MVQVVSIDDVPMMFGSVSFQSNEVSGAQNSYRGTRTLSVRLRGGRSRGSGRGRLAVFLLLLRRPSNRTLLLSTTFLQPDVPPGAAAVRGLAA